MAIHNTNVAMFKNVLTGETKPPIGDFHAASS